MADCAREFGELKADVKNIGAQLDGIWEEIKSNRKDSVEVKTELAKYKGGLAILSILFGSISAVVTSVVANWFRK